VPEVEEFPSRREAVEMAFARAAAGHERLLGDIALAFASKGDDGAWSRV
jgi:hypothetical protein